MQMKKACLICFGFLLLVSNAMGQASPESKIWGIETELFQPVYPTVQIIRIQATRTVTPLDSKRNGDLIIGAYIRPNVKHDVVEKINEYMLAIGYRQYLWKGLHVEAKSNMGYAWGTRNLIDNKDYETATWFWEANVGYRFHFIKRSDYSIYLAPQFGGIGNIVADIGPRGGKPDNFLHGNILLGIRF
jgi:hypothetical protein